MNKHLKEQNVGYFTHFWLAIKISLALIIHAFIPDLFSNYASKKICRISGDDIAKALGHMDEDGEWITDPKDDIEDHYTDYDVQFEDNFPYIEGKN